MKDQDFASFDKYSEEVKVDQLSKFLDQYAYKQVKAVAAFTQLTERKYNSGQLCSPKDSSLCVLVFGEPSEADKALVLLFQSEPVQFAYIPKGQPGYRMRDTHFGGSDHVLLKAKRSKYIALERLDYNGISDALGGGGTWNKYEQTLKFEKISEDL